MKRWIITLGFLFVACAMVFSAPASADTQDKVLARLDVIEQKEDQILKQLDQMMAELKIVKVRATLKA